MSYLKHGVLTDAFAESDKLAKQGRLYAAFTLMSKVIKDNFTRIGVIHALFYMFQIVDEYNVNNRVLYKIFFIRTAHHDVNKIIYFVKNKPQLHFWAGCLKICQFRNEIHFSLLTRKIEIIKKIRRHFQIAIKYKPSHIMAPYLLTACDITYFDLCGTIPYPDISSRNPEEYYNCAINTHPEYLLAFSFLLGKLTFYVYQYDLAISYLNMVLACVPKTPLENHFSYDSLMILNKIDELRKVN